MIFFSFVPMLFIGKKKGEGGEGKRENRSFVFKRTEQELILPDIDKNVMFSLSSVRERGGSTCQEKKPSEPVFIQSAGASSKSPTDTSFSESSSERNSELFSLPFSTSLTIPYVFLYVYHIVKMTGRYVHSNYSPSFLPR